MGVWLGPTLPRVAQQGLVTEMGFHCVCSSPTGWIWDDPPLLPAGDGAKGPRKAGSCPESRVAASMTVSFHSTSHYSLSVLIW